MILRYLFSMITGIFHTHISEVSESANIILCSLDGANDLRKQIYCYYDHLEQISLNSSPQVTGDVLGISYSLVKNTKPLAMI